MTDCALIDRCWPDPSVLDALNTAGAFAVIPHVLPDTDALGSAEGLCRILRAARKRAWVFAPDVPGIYQWALAEDVRGSGDPPSDLVRIGIDTARPDRLQVPGPVAINIDHHEDNPHFGQAANWVAVAPSCTCLLPGLAEALRVPVEGPLATALYTGLVGDTECFRVNLSPDAFAWAAWLADRGADCEGTAERFLRRSPGFWGYLAAVEQAGYVLEGPGAPSVRVLPIPADLPSRFSLLHYENALLPSHLSPPAGGILAILQDGKNGVRFRIRSRDVDVLPLAHTLGGGGHPQAAGVQLTGATLAEAEARLREAWGRVAAGAR